MQYSIQGLNCEDPARKDLLMDIGTEELSHLEIVGTLARMHLQPMKAFRDAAEVDPLVAIAGGGGVNLFNSMGNPWTADYLKITGELDVDLRSNIAAEARAKIVYERLINFCTDAGIARRAAISDDARDHAHEGVRRRARQHAETRFFGRSDSTHARRLVNKYFDDSTGQGDEGETDARGPWNEGNGWELVHAPAFDTFRSHGRSKVSGDGEASSVSETLTESLTECLQDLLDAENQLVKALPKMAKAARNDELRQAFEQHLAETEQQITRLEEVFGLIGGEAAKKQCKGMAGLVAEGQDVIAEGKSKEDMGADIALIAAAQKVEHYEISNYLRACVLASQAGHTAAALLLGQSLLEEEAPTRF